MNDKKEQGEELLLINPPLQGAMFFPLGLGYIAAVLSKAGYKIKVLDINAFKIDSAKVEEYIRTCKYGIFLTGAILGESYRYVKWLSQIIKKHHPNSKIIAGNSVATSIPEVLLKNSEIDYLVRGEGEETIIELLDAIEHEKNLKDIKGIAFRDKDEIIITPNRERISDLDNLPFPAWQLFPMEKYVGKMVAERLDEVKGKGMVVTAGRGCPYHCTYCYHIFGHQNHMRGVKNVVDEIEELNRKYHVNIIYFMDDLFMVYKQWVKDFCNELAKRNLKIYWRCAGRTNLVGMNDLKLLREMKKAGCVAIQYGIETGSPKLINLANKQVTLEQMEEAIRVTRLSGIEITLGWMIGFPEETKETLQETINFCVKNEISLTSMFFVTPYPGTPLYEETKERGLIKNEEKYLDKLHDSEFNINLTKFSNEELFNLREWVINKVNRAYFKKHGGEYLKWIIKKQKWHLDYIRHNGIKGFLKTAVNNAIRRAKGI
ncbi:MAG: radical SAM protein [archaeon]